MKNKVKNDSGRVQKRKIGISIREIKIQYRLIASFVALLLISMLLVSSLVYIILENSLKSKATTYSENIMEQVSLNINGKLSEVEGVYGKMDDLGVFASMENSKNKDDAFEQYTLLNNITSKITPLIAFNKAIRTLIIVDNNKLQIGTIPQFMNNDKEALDKFINIAKEDNNKFRWTYYIEPGKKPSEGHFMLLKAIVSKTSKAYMGTMIVEYDQKNLAYTYNNIDLGKNSEIFTVDFPGNLVAATKIDNIDKEYTTPNFIKKINDNDMNNKDQKKIETKIAGQNRLIIYSKVKNVDLYNIVTIPISNYSRDSNFMLIFMVLMGGISLGLGIIVATIVSKSITNPLKSFMNYIKVVGKGDLSFRSEDLSKDEIGIINTNFSDMLTKVSELIIEVKDMSENVGINTNKIKILSEHSKVASEQVAGTMEEISKGAKEQADGVAEGVNIMEKLAKGINDISNKMTGVSKIINNSKDTIEGSMIIIKTLNDKSEETNEFSKEIIKEINDLNNDMKEIKEITDLIMNISGQTNLLSLNAAIEASKAGEAGKGFSVVADEVRNLAIQSKDASIKINNIINEVKVKTEYTVKEANGSTSIVSEQIEAVEKTNDAFRDMSQSMNGVNSQIEKMKESVENILKLKEIAMTTISEIAAISEETSSSTENVSASTQEQIAGVQELGEFISILTHMSEELNISIEKFTLE